MASYTTLLFWPAGLPPQLLEFLMNSSALLWAQPTWLHNNFHWIGNKQTLHIIVSLTWTFVIFGHLLKWQILSFFLGEQTRNASCIRTNTLLNLLAPDSNTLIRECGLKKMWYGCHANTSDCIKSFSGSNKILLDYRLINTEYRHDLLTLSHVFSHIDLPVTTSTHSMIILWKCADYMDHLHTFNGFPLSSILPWSFEIQLC